LSGTGGDKQQLVDGGSNTRDGEQFEVSPLQVEPSAAERYAHIGQVDPQAAEFSCQAEYFQPEKNLAS